MSDSFVKVTRRPDRKVFGRWEWSAIAGDKQSFGFAFTESGALRKAKNYIRAWNA